MTWQSQRNVKTNLLPNIDEWLEKSDALVTENMWANHETT